MLLEDPHCDLIIKRTNTGAFISVARVGDAWPGRSSTEAVDTVHIPISKLGNSASEGREHILCNAWPQHVSSQHLGLPVPVHGLIAAELPRATASSPSKQVEWSIISALCPSTPLCMA